MAQFCLPSTYSPLFPLYLELPGFATSRKAQQCQNRRIARNHVICVPLSPPGVLLPSVAVGYQLLERLEWYLMSTTLENRARGIFPWDCTRLNLRTQFSYRPFAELGASIILAIHGTSIVDLFGPGG